MTQRQDTGAPLPSELAGFASDVEKSAQDLAQIEARQAALAEGVRTGKLWMDPDTAEEAAARCETFAGELLGWVARTDLLTNRPRYGDDRTDEAYVSCSEAHVHRIRQYARVALRMAETYREAGCLDRGPAREATAQ